MLSAADIEAIAQSMIALGRYAESKDRKNLKIEYKADYSPVSEVDLYVSEQIIGCLRSIMPDVDVVSEEHIVTPRSNTYWLVDPIDGTMDYIRGGNNFTINVALIINGKPEYGFMYNPPTDNFCYTDADKNVHVFHGRERLHDRNIVASFGSRGKNELCDRFCRQFQIKNIIRASGAVKLCWLASGAVDVVPAFYQTMEWDIAAGHAILKAMGGNIFDLDGYEMTYNKKEWINEGFLAFNKKFANLALE